VIDRFHREIEVEVRPRQMVGMPKLHVQELSDRNVSEPRRLLERQEKFPASKQEPESMLRNVGYLNPAMLFPSCADLIRVPESGGALC
jgi:hypothetical protein